MQVSLVKDQGAMVRQQDNTHAEFERLLRGAKILHVLHCGRFLTVVGHDPWLSLDRLWSGSSHPATN